MGSRVQVLVAAMHQNDHSLLEKLNIQSDAIVGNQCNYNSIEHFTWGKSNNNITYLNLNERGVGLNRNNALMRATGEFCIFADDDMTYIDGYPQIVEKCFDENKDADVIVFNIKENQPTRYIIKKFHRVRWHNFLRYGAVRIAIRRNKVFEQGILFNLCFGGGTEHSAGEDNLFLSECLKKGLHIYAVPKFIVQLNDDRESTWFQGYTEKYFTDKGIFYSVLSKRWRRILCLQDCIRHKKLYGMKWEKAYLLMLSGFSK